MFEWYLNYFSEKAKEYLKKRKKKKKSGYF